MNKNYMKILNLSNESIKNLLIPFEKKFQIEQINPENLTRQIFENIKPDIVITSIISKRLLNWKEKMCYSKLL